MSIATRLQAGETVSATLRLETAFHVFEEHDKTEGKGGRSLKYIVSSRSEADKLAKGLGVWGGNGDVVEVKTVRIRPNDSTQAACFDLSNLREPAKEDKARLAAAARAKLTIEEAEALGLLAR